MLSKYYNRAKKFHKGLRAEIEGKGQRAVRARCGVIAGRLPNQFENKVGNVVQMLTDAHAQYTGKLAETIHTFVSSKAGKKAIVDVIEAGIRVITSEEVSQLFEAIDAALPLAHKTLADKGWVSPHEEPEESPEEPSELTEEDVKDLIEVHIRAAVEERLAFFRQRAEDAKHNRSGGLSL